jgi:hypothetical protein
MTTLKNNMRKAVLASAVLAGLAALCGCDQWTTYDPLLGYANFPQVTPYYDPTETIQSVWEYRQEVYDNSNAAWDEYIRE